MPEKVHTTEAPEPIGPYSQAITCSAYVFCSGQIALDPQTGDIIRGNASEQADRALRNLGAVLNAAGLSYSDVVKTTLYLVDMNDFQAVNTVYAKYFGMSAPARTTVAVAALPKGSLVEVDAIASRND